MKIYYCSYCGKQLSMGSPPKPVWLGVKSVTRYCSPACKDTHEKGLGIIDVTKSPKFVKVMGFEGKVITLNLVKLEEIIRNALRIEMHGTILHVGDYHFCEGEIEVVRNLIKKIEEE